MTPDLPTLMLVSALTGAVGAATFAFVLDDFSSELRPHARAWAIGLGLMAASWLLMVGRGIVPVGVSILASNAALAASLVLQLVALRGFFGLPPWRWRYAALLLAQLSISVVFTWVHDSLVARIVLGSVVLALLLLEASVLLARHGERPAPRGQHLLFTYLLALVAALLWRGVMVMLSPGVTAAETLALPANVATHALAAALPLVGSIGFLLLLHHRLARRLIAQAAEDALTGLSNLRGFEHAATARWEHGEALALLAVDADHFKRINDAHGHAVGDAVLRWLGRQLTRAARQDDVVARLGGEEFVRLLPGATPEQAVAAAERLRASVAGELFDEGSVRLAVTVSIGVATRRADDADLDAVLRRADDALYAAKAAGRNRVERAA